MKRPPLECDCHVCSDDTITMCLDEAHRLLQIDYSEVDLVDVDFEYDGNTRASQMNLNEFSS